MTFECENHKLFWIIPEKDFDEFIVLAYAKHAFLAFQKLRGKRANNAMNSYKIQKEVERRVKWKQ